MKNSLFHFLNFRFNQQLQYSKNSHIIKRLNLPLHGEQENSTHQEMTQHLIQTIAHQHDPSALPGATTQEHKLFLLKVETSKVLQNI